MSIAATNACSMASDPPSRVKMSCAVALPDSRSVTDPASEPSTSPISTNATSQPTSDPRCSRHASASGVRSDGVAPARPSRGASRPMPASRRAASATAARTSTAAAASGSSSTHHLLVDERADLLRPADRRQPRQPRRGAGVPDGPQQERDAEDGDRPCRWRRARSCPPAPRRRRRRRTPHRTPRHAGAERERTGRCRATRDEGERRQHPATSDAPIETSSAAASSARRPTTAGTHQLGPAGLLLGAGVPHDREHRHDAGQQRQNATDAPRDEAAGGGRGRTPARTARSSAGVAQRRRQRRPVGGRGEQGVVRGAAVVPSSASTAHPDRQQHPVRGAAPVAPAGPVPASVDAVMPRRGLVAVVAQEQLLQGRRLAVSVRTPCGSSCREHPSSFVRVDVEARRCPSTRRSWTPAAARAPVGRGPARR